MTTWKWIAVAAVASVLAFVGGRWLAPVPERVITTEKVKEVVVTDSRLEQVVSELEQIRRDYSEFKTKILSERYRRVYDETVTADGAKTVHEEVTHNIDSHETETKVETEVKVVEVEKKVVEIRTETKTVEVEKKVVVENKSSFTLTPMVGVQLLPLELPPSKIFSRGIVFGGSASVRLAKTPISVGVWGLSSGVGGVQASVEF